eukprot:5639159-Amphidinium_carterae.1
MLTFPDPRILEVLHSRAGWRGHGACTQPFGMEVGREVRITCPYSNQEDLGYLDLDPGDAVLVQYVGQEGEEIGWAFGKKIGTDQEGWFPASACSGVQAHCTQAVDAGSA